jgi:hypothetical protein
MCHGTTRPWTPLLDAHQAPPLDAILEHLRSDGGVIVERMVDADTVGQLLDTAVARAEDFDPDGATQGMGEDGKDFVGHNTIRFSGLGKISPAYFDPLDNELFASVAAADLWVVLGQHRKGRVHRTGRACPDPASRFQQFVRVRRRHMAQLPRDHDQRDDRPRRGSGPGTSRDCWFFRRGAREENRTADLFITSDLALNAVPTVENPTFLTVSDMRCAQSYLLSWWSLRPGDRPPTKK